MTRSAPQLPSKKGNYIANIHDVMFSVEFNHIRIKQLFRRSTTPIVVIFAYESTYKWHWSFHKWVFVILFIYLLQHLWLSMNLNGFYACKKASLSLYFAICHQHMTLQNTKKDECINKHD